MIKGSFLGIPSIIQIGFFPGIFRKFCCLPIFRILGRLTYGAFIIHLLVARIVLATVREPIYFGTGMMVSYNI